MPPNENSWKIFLFVTNNRQISRHKYYSAILSFIDFQCFQRNIFFCFFFFLTFSSQIWRMPALLSWCFIVYRRHQKIKMKFVCVFCWYFISLLFKVNVNIKQLFISAQANYNIWCFVNKALFFIGVHKMHAKQKYNLWHL